MPQQPGHVGAEQIVWDDLWPRSGSVFLAALKQARGASPAFGVPCNSAGCNISLVSTKAHMHA